MLGNNYFLQEAIAATTFDPAPLVADYKKAKLAFINLFTTVDTLPRIDATEEGNKNKIEPINLKGRIEFRNNFCLPNETKSKCA